VDHPSDIYESKNLSTVNGPPLTYVVSAALQEVYRNAKISTFQLETVRHICQCLSHRKTFFLGDGTGCGKGRMIASAALEFVERDRRVLWVSMNKRLFQDAMRDTNVLESPQLTWGKFTAALSFITYNECVNDGVREQVKSWLRGPHECLVILDECHWLRNASKSSLCLRELLDSLPHCKILYSSATAASVPSHFRYTDGLGLWGEEDSPFQSLGDFKSSLTRNGDTIMELVALHLKSRGVYVSRHLSMNNVQVHCVKQELDETTRDLYNRCARVFSNNHFTQGMKHQMFWQRFLARTKVPGVLELIQHELDRGNAVIVALQNTGEASDVRNMTPESPDYVSTCQEIFEQVAPNSVVPDFALDPIDAIVHRFGSHNVAEITGRHRRVTLDTNGDKVYASKPTPLQEHKDFQSGKKDIAILSRAGSTGISLHAELAHSKPRVHVCLELPWSPEDFLQQCGRSHRASETQLPVYKFVYTSIPSELRFVSSMSQKLASLGALTKADRDSSVSLLQTPERWSTAAKREVALRICYDFMLDKLKSSPTPNIPTLPSGRVYELLGCHPNCSMNRKRINLLLCVSRTIETTERQPVSPVDTHLYPQAIAMIRVVLVDHKAWSSGRFSQEHSSLYSRRTKGPLVGLLLARQAWECRNTLGSLPDSLFDLIYEQVAKDCHIDSSALYSSLMPLMSPSVSIVSLPTMPNDTLQNRLLGLTIEDQHTFHRVMGDAAQNNGGKKCKGVHILEHYRKKVNGNSLSISMRISGRDPTDYWIDVVSELPVYPDLSAEQSILNVLTQQVHKIRFEGNLVLMYKPCMVDPSRRFTVDQFEQEVAEGRVVFCGDSRFESKHTNRIRHLTNRIHLSRYRYRIAVFNGLNRWESSEKTLLSFDVDGDDMVGLLISCERINQPHL
tara:strand:+ start:766 stop:3477 length:2712 start_codon:yes stop_codon:yes gene_type:complete